MSKYIWIKNRRYYWYNNYDSWKDAYVVGRYYNRKNKKCKYFILKREVGYIVPKDVYSLYMTGVIVLGGRL